MVRREVIMKITRVFGEMFIIPRVRKYFEDKCDFPLISFFKKKCFTALFMFLVFNNPTPRGARDAC